MTDTQNINRILIETYPWLEPKNVWTGKPEEDYNYQYTWLDNMEPGWRDAFGIEMCEKIQNALNEIKDQEDAKTFMPVDIKEKYAELRFYTNWTTEQISDIINEYTKKSRRTCGYCGAEATKITTGWYYPLCDKCFERSYSDYPDDYIDINEFYKEDE